MSNYNSVSKISEEKEKQLLQLFINKGWMGEISPKDQAYGWDLSVTGTTGGVGLIEVKCDLQASKTGNIAVEVAKKNHYTNNQEPSGISIIQANLIAYCVPDNNSYWITNTTNLLSHINANNYTTIWCGDKGRFKNVLIPFEDYKKISRKVN